MNLGELPEELVVEQLRHLPYQDLFSACQVDSRLSQICRGRLLWQTLIRDAAPELDLRRVDDPREFFYQNFILGRGLYLNFMLQPERPTEESANRIAQSLGVPYVIVYTTPIPDPEVGLRFTDLGLQTQEIRNIPQSFTNVDILTFDLLPEELQTYLDGLTRITLSGAQRVNVTFNLGGHTTTLNVCYRDLLNGTIFRLRDMLRSGHKEHNTLFYRVMMERISAARERSSIPSLQEPVKEGDLNARREAMINFLLQNMNEYTFNRGLNHWGNDYLGFRSYNEFIEAQRKFVNRMDEGQLRTLEFMKDQMLPESRLLDEEVNSVIKINTFILNVTGKLILTIPR